MHAMNEQFFIAPQITTETMQAARDAGVTDVLMNRPDGEEPGMPTRAELEEAATAAGLAFHYVPMHPGQLEIETVDAVARIIDTMEGKGLGFCKTGARSAALYSLACVKSGKASPERMLEAAGGVGFDLSGLMPLMRDLHVAAP